MRKVHITIRKSGELWHTESEDWDNLHMGAPDAGDLVKEVFRYAEEIFHEPVTLVVTVELFAHLH